MALIRIPPAGINALSLQAVRGNIAGLTMSNNAGDATNDIDVAVGAAIDSTVVDVLQLSSGLTKQLDATWAVGNNVGGRASGAAITDTTYHVFVIKRPDTGVTDIAYDTSVTGANVVANTNAAYTLRRRIGSIMRVAGVITPFNQNGDEFVRLASVLDVNANNPGTSAVTRTLSVPLGVKVLANVNLGATYNWAGTQPIVYLSSLDQNDEAPSATVAPIGSLADTMTTATGTTTQIKGPMYVRTNTSAQIRSRIASSDAGVTILVATIGWIDTRGKDS